MHMRCNQHQHCPGRQHKSRGRTSIDRGWGIIIIIIIIILKGNYTGLHKVYSELFRIKIFEICIRTQGKLAISSKEWFTVRSIGQFPFYWGTREVPPFATLLPSVLCKAKIAACHIHTEAHTHSCLLAASTRPAISGKAAKQRQSRLCISWIHNSLLLALNVLSTEKRSLSHNTPPVQPVQSIQRLPTAGQ